MGGWAGGTGSEQLQLRASLYPKMFQETPGKSQETGGREPLLCMAVWGPCTLVPPWNLTLPPYQSRWS